MKTCLTFLFAVGLLFAGDYDRVGTTAPIFIQAMPIEALYSVGFSNMFAAGAAEIASGNPASLSTFSHPSIGFDYAYASRIKQFEDVYLERDLQRLPLSAGAVYPLQNVQFGFTYQRKYSSYIDFGEIPITTIENPGGTGETMRAKSQTNLHSFSAIVCFAFEEMFKTGDRLALGVQVSADNIDVNEKIYMTEGRVTDRTFSSRLGIQYRLNSQFGIAFVLDKAPHFSSTVRIKNESFVMDSSSGYTIYINQESSNAYRFIMPDKAVLGVQFALSEQLSFSCTAAYVQWSKVSSGYRDQFNFSLGSTVALAGLFDVSAGVYSSDRQNRESAGLWGNQARYFNLGVRKQIGPAIARIEWYDSHGLSDERRKQTIVKAGFSWVFR